MKIVMLTPYWVSTIGGITTYVYNLAEEVRKIDKTEVVVVTRDKGSGAIGINGNKITFLFKLPYIMRKIRPDVIHCYDIGTLLLSALLYRVLFNRRVKTIFTFLTQPREIHKVIFLKNEKVKRKPWWKIKLFGFALKKCNFITCGARVIGEEFISIDNLPIRDFIVIPAAPKQKPVTQSQMEKFREDYNLKDLYPIICTVGVLVLDCRVKGVELLIRAFAKIRASYPDGRLLVIGDGPFRKSLELLTKKLGMQNCVVFTGNLENPFIPLSISDIYCQLQLSEGVGIATLEAMISGKPVVVLKAGETAEVVRHGKDGMLVEPDVEDVVKNLIKLIDDPDMAKQLGDNARISISEKFAWPKIAKQYMELYAKVV